MAGMNETPSGERVHIAFFGVCNAGKSSVVNAVTGQDLSVVSDTAGTTTDAVRKAMELLPLGPVVIIDTPGIDDAGALGDKRVERTRRVLRECDVAVLVTVAGRAALPAEEDLLAVFRAQGVPFVVAANKCDLLEGAGQAGADAEGADGVATQGAAAGDAGTGAEAEGAGQAGAEASGVAAEGVHGDDAAVATAAGNSQLSGGVRLAVSALTGAHVNELKELIARVALEGASAAGSAPGASSAADAAALTDGATDAEGVAQSASGCANTSNSASNASPAAGVPAKPLVADLIATGDTVVLVVPIDSSAPKGRIILPQQMVLRDVLDAHAQAMVCQPQELSAVLSRMPDPPRLVITDSQAFARVAAIVPEDVALTSFSILMARYKGELAPFLEGARALSKLCDGDAVLVAEGCTHHRQCEDIGAVKIPTWIRAFSGAEPHFEFCSGRDFPSDLSKYALVVHCGGCMLNAREMHSRIREAQQAGVPIVNYGMAIAHMHGILERSLRPLLEGQSDSSSRG